MDRKLETLLDNLLNPGEEYSPIPFWFLNDRLEPDELTRQLFDFKEKGVDAVVIHPRIGIPRDLVYLSSDYFDLMEHICETAAKLDMRLVLYDEGMYPSGSAHGGVVRENPDYAAVGLYLRDEPSSGKLVCQTLEGQYLVADRSHGTIRGIHFGEDDGEAGAPAASDLLNPAAVSCFIRLTHDAYFERLESYFGHTVIGFFTDEPSILGRNTAACFPWTPGLEQELVDAGAKLSELTDLFLGQESESTRIYWRVVRERLNNVYYKQLHDWCEAHGIWLMGHPESSDDIDLQVYFHVPGQDLVFRWISPEEGGLVGIHSVQAKCSADAARHLGRSRNSNECFGVCGEPGDPWNFTADDMLWYINWLGVRGVNLFIPHAFYYSLRGERKNERPPDVGPHNIWWPYYRQFSDYMKRISGLMTGGRNMAEVAVITKSGQMPHDELIPFYENQVEFNYLQESLLADASFGNHMMTVGSNTYRYYMADQDLDLPLPRIHAVDEAYPQIFRTLVPEPMLRLTHLHKDGLDHFFLTNEGEEQIRTEALIRAQGSLVAVDLWTGEHWVPATESHEGDLEVRLELERRSSLLLVVWPDKLVPTEQVEPRLLPASFELAAEDTEAYVKHYRATIHVDEVLGMEYIAPKGEEMLVCRCNGEDVGVSFYRPHRFKLTASLRPGENTIELTVYGSIANRYGEKPKAYGLTEN